MKPAPEAPREEAGSPAACTAAGRGTRFLDVLLIDDSPIISRYLIDEVNRERRWRIRLTHLPNLTEGMARLRKGGVDVVLLDLFLPESTGLGTLLQVHEHFPDLPIVVLTGLDDSYVAMDAVSLGAQDFLPKSNLDADRVARAVRYAHERHALAAALWRRTQELRSREAALHKIVSMFCEALLVVDALGVVRFANRAAEPLLQRAVRDLLGAPLRDLIDAPDMGADTAAREVLVLARGIRCHLTSAEIEWEGAPARMVCLREIEDAESLGMVTAGIAHDFNNFLTSASLNVHLARRLSADSPRVAEVLSDIDKAIPRARDLTRQLLALSTCGAPVREPSGLADLVHECARFVLSGTPVQGAFDLPDGLWRVEADRGQIAQVIHNVVLNAVQSMPNGGTVRIAAANMAADEAAGRPCVRLQVQDEGCGMDSGTLERIFEPYFTTKAGGSGLGLATSQSIVRRHGGEVRVASTVGRGSCFSVYLPACVER